MELLMHGGKHHEIGDGGLLMMTTATNPPLRSPERTPDQPSREVLGLIWSPFGAPERGIRRHCHHQPSDITNFMMLTAMRE